MPNSAMTASLEIISLAILVTYDDAVALPEDHDNVAISPAVASFGANARGTTAIGPHNNDNVTLDRFAAHPGGRPFSGDRSGGKL